MKPERGTAPDSPAELASLYPRLQCLKCTQAIDNAMKAILDHARQHGAAVGECFTPFRAGSA